MMCSEASGKGGGDGGGGDVGDNDGDDGGGWQEITHQNKYLHPHNYQHDK